MLETIYYEIISIWSDKIYKMWQGMMQKAKEKLTGKLEYISEEINVKIVSNFLI